MNAMVRAGDIANSLEEIQRVGRMLAMTGYFAAKGDTPQAIAQIATQILAGREMGYGPFASVQGIHIIQGKPTLSANLMASAVKNSPRYDYRVREISDQICRIEFFEYVDGKRESLGISEFTLEQAQKAGVKNLDKYARNMLFARAMSNGVRWFCPDVFSGNAVYVPEELGAEVDGEGDVIEVTGVHIDDAPEISQDGPTASQSAKTSQHTTQDAATPQNGAVASTEAKNGTPTDAELKILETWATVEDAYQWAVDEGICSHREHARNAFQGVIDNQFGGRFTKANAAGVYLAYLRDRLAKQQRMQQEAA